MYYLKVAGHDANGRKVSRTYPPFDYIETTLHPTFEDSGLDDINEYRSLFPQGPGMQIELCYRDREKPSDHVYLPTDGEVAYLMDALGNTLDSYRPPTVNGQQRPAQPMTHTQTPTEEVSIR